MISELADIQEKLSIARYDTAMARAVVESFETHIDGIESLLQDPDNAQAIYQAAKCLRHELEALCSDTNILAGAEEPKT